MKRILFLTLLVLLFSCKKSEDEQPSDDIILGWENVVYQPDLTSIKLHYK